MDRLTTQQAGNPATAKWANEVVDELRRQKLISGNGVRLTVTSSGTRIDLDIPPEAPADDSPSSDESCVPVVITGQYLGKAYNGIKIRIPGVSYSSSSGGENELLYLPHVTPSTALPLGITVLAHRIDTTEIQSSND